jgi:AcrR family transcriptional regulator
MPRRKPQEYEERRLQIIDGALQVFSTKGFVQATNKDIAAAAGINSPGLIYHYFKDKADLLRAVAEQYAPPLQLVARADEMMTLPPQEALTRFGLSYLRLTDDPTRASFLRLLMGEALRDPEFARLLGEVGPLRMLRFLTEYLRRQMEQGVLRPIDPSLAARCFVGPLIVRLFLRQIFQLPDLVEVTPEALMATHVEVFLQGLQALNPQITPISTDEAGDSPPEIL